MSMAPPTATTRPRHRRRIFLFRPLLTVLLAFAVWPASSRLFTPPPSDAFSRAFSPPSAYADAGGGSGTFSLTTSLLFVALFLLGFCSAYLRRCFDAATGARRGGGGTLLTPNAAVATAAFASAAGNGGRRCPGLDSAAMEALPVLTYGTARAVKAGRGALECAVCLAEFGDDSEKLRLLPGCCHVFHAACIDVWLATHVTCPVCRADLSNPAVADAGHVLSADLSAQEDTTITPSNRHAVVNVNASESAHEQQDSTSSDSDQQAAETAEERVDRYTLRLPERLTREIEDARRHRRAMSAVTAVSSGRWTSEALRTMSAARLSPR
jgi:E3 ubiquitin-protein ligase ATL6/9/15/31/42/55